MSVRRRHDRLPRGIRRGSRRLTRSWRGRGFSGRGLVQRNSEATTDMANTPKKMKDPTEAALSAIQDALQCAGSRPAEGPDAGVSATAADPRSRTTSRCRSRHGAACAPRPPRPTSSTTTKCGAPRTRPRCAARPTTTRNRSARSCAPCSAARHARPTSSRPCSPVVWVLGGLAARLDVSSRTAGRARPDRPDRAGARRAGRDLLRADHLLLRARPHGRGGRRNCG